MKNIHLFAGQYSYSLHQQFFVQGANQGDTKEIISRSASMRFEPQVLARLLTLRRVRECIAVSGAR